MKIVKIKMHSQNYFSANLRKVYDTLKENIDYKKGILFGGLAGVAVGAINAKEGIEYALSSGTKEGAKCLLIGTVNLSICRKLATTIENKVKAITLATVVPAVLSMGLTYGVHAYLKGTPYPLKSTAPTALSAPFFLVIAMRERKLAEKKKAEANNSISINSHKCNCPADAPCKLSGRCTCMNGLSEKLNIEEIN
jgi:hypothetical protein